MFNEVLDESDNSVLEENEAGVTYSVKFESGDKALIEKMVDLWKEQTETS